LSAAGEENNRKSSSLETVIKLPAKYLISVIGAVVSISGFITLVTTRSVKVWVKVHPYPIYLALIVAILIIAGILEYAYMLRSRIAVPSDHDRKFYAAALDRLPPNGTVVGWLKRADTGISITDFPADVLETLEKMVEFSRVQSVGFDDKHLADSFRFLTDAIAAFCQSVETWTFAEHARQFGSTASLPPQALSAEEPHPHDASCAGEAGVAEEAITLTRIRESLVQAYDRFIRTAHARGIDIDR
jgi:hypothetical protein